MELARAFEIANGLLRRLEPVCERVAIAGSVRRGKPEVKDIEIVAILWNTGATNLFGESVASDLDVSVLGRPVKAGPKYKQVLLPEGINLDLFIVTPPAQWGVIFAMRTGPAEFSKALVTSRRFGGYLPGWAKVDKGAVWSHGEIIPTPEEQDFFNICEIPAIRPEYRAGVVGSSWISLKSK